MQARRVLVLTVVTLFVSAALPARAQRNNDASKQPTRSAQEQQDVQALVQTVELALLSDLGIQCRLPAPPPQTPHRKLLTLGAPDSSGNADQGESNHFVKGQTDTYIPSRSRSSRKCGLRRHAIWIAWSTSSRRPRLPRWSRLLLLPSRKATTRRRLPHGRRSRGTTAASWTCRKTGSCRGRFSSGRDNTWPTSPLKRRARRRLPPNQGNNRNNRNAPAPAPAAAPGKVGLLRHEITVPDFGVADLTTSSVILARSVEQVAAPPADQESNPYVFGPMRIVPSPDGRFAKSAELSVIFWIYGAQAAATGKPDVTIEYNFHQKLAEGEKYFNKTAPQQLDATTLPQEFNVAAGHQLPGSLVVPLSSFPSADYRLEIKITDKTSGKSVTQNVNFSVLPV
jgi:hypothetical protein